MFCPDCGFKNNDGDIFCARCGVRLPDEQPEQNISGSDTVQVAVETQQAAKICSSCGFGNSDDDAFCAKCGTKLSNVPVLKNDTNPMLHTSEDIQHSSRNKCNNCNHENDADAVFCEKCGTALSDTAPFPHHTEPTPEEVAQSTSYDNVVTAATFQAPIENAMISPAVYSDYSNPAYPATKVKSKKPVIILSVSVVLAACLLIALFIFKPWESNSNTADYQAAAEPYVQEVDDTPAATDIPATPEPEEPDINQMKTSLNTDWKHLYISFISESTRLSSYDEGNTQYALLYIDNDEIPELVIRTVDEDNGDSWFGKVSLHTVYNETVHDRVEYDWGFPYHIYLSYIERENLFKISVWTHGSGVSGYWDNIYIIEDGKFIALHSGEIADLRDYATYCWDGIEISSDDYNHMLTKAFDDSKTNAINYYTFNEIISILEGIDNYISITDSENITPDPTQQHVLSPEPQTLLEAVHNTDYWMRLTVDRPASGRGSTIFERELNSNIWLITSITGEFRMNDPMFRQSGDAVRIEFATTSNTYTLNDGAIGMSGDGIGASKDAIVWSVEVGSDSPLGKMYDENLTDNLRQAMADYKLVTINIYFDNGDKAIIYHNLDGKWNLRPRETGFTTISPSIAYDGTTTIFTFEHNSRECRYELHEGGYANINGESAAWSYVYYVR